MRRQRAVSLETEQEDQVRKIRNNAALIAGQFKVRSVKPKLKIVGNTLKVAPSTIMQ